MLRPLRWCCTRSGLKLPVLLPHIYTSIFSFIPLLFLWENQAAVFLSVHFPVIDIRALCHPDCQSIFGLAREVAAALGQPLKTPALDYTETEVEKEGFEVTVDAQDLCPRYIAHYVYDVKLGQSPAWMRRRLALVGNNSISNIVDITNYIMRELGQPLHAFDCNFLEGNAIQVRRANEGE